MPKIDRKHISLFLRLAVVLAAIIWAGLMVSRQWESFAEYFRQMNPWVFVFVLGICVLGQILVSLRWWLLLRSQSIRIEFWAAVRLFFLGWFYNNFMPSSVGGDLVRAWYVTHHTEKKFEAALSVFVDRVVGLVSTLVIAVFFYTVFLRGQSGLTFSHKQGGLGDLIAEYQGIILTVLGLMACGFAAMLLIPKIRARLKNLLSLIRLKGMKIFTKLKGAAVIYCSKPMALLGVFGLTVIMQIMVISGFWLLGRSMGIDVGIKYYYVIFTLSWVLGAIPISIGGAGVVEGSLVIMFTQLTGIDESAALAIALSQRALWMLISLPGAAIHLFGAHLPKDFSVDYNEPIA